MYFLDLSFFTGDIHIPNLEEVCNVDLTIYKLIAKWEREALELSLGKCLADELIAQLEIVDGNNGSEYRLKSDADPKWEWLINGRKYSETDEDVDMFYDLSVSGCGCGSGNCTVHNWEGIVKEQTTIIRGSEATYKESYLAYYVYFMWTFDNASRTTGTGEQLPEAKNSTSVPNKAKRIAAWNYFWSWTRGCQRGGQTGLHTFLKEHAGLFPTFEEIYYQNQNIYGI